MENNSNFVLTALHSWGWGRPANARRVAEEISKKHRVLYVNPPMDFKSILHGYKSCDYGCRMRIIDGNEPALKQINPNLWVLDPPILVTPVGGICPDNIFDMVNKHNNKRLAKTIRWAMGDVDFNIHDFIHINDNDVCNGFFIKDLLQPKLSLYYRCNNLLFSPSLRSHGARLEREIARKSDGVITNCQHLVDSMHPHNQHTYNIGQGTDVVISHAECPAELKQLPHPIIACIGNLGVIHNSPSLIQRVAQAHSECSVVLIGPEDQAFVRHSVHGVKNVYFLGARDIDSISDYIEFIDVLINPLVINDLTNDDYSPVIDLSLAYGKPIVSILSKSMASYYNYVHLATGEKQFLDELDSALSECGNESLATMRRKFVDENSWNSCVNRLFSVIDYVTTEHESRRLHLSMNESHIQLT